jgi:hypothetical protein
LTLASEILARRMRLPRAETRDVVCERDLAIAMDDGAVLLADRYVAQAVRDRPQPRVLVRSPYGRRQVFGLISGGCWPSAACRSSSQSVRGTFGSEGTSSPFDERADGRATLRWISRAAVARRPDRHDRRQLPRAGAVAGCARGRRRPRGAGHPGQRVAVGLGDALYSAATRRNIDVALSVNSAALEQEGAATGA